MRRSPARLALVALAMASAMPASAQAQGSDSRPAGGHLRLEPRSGVEDGGRVYVARGQRVEIEGVVSRFVGGQSVEVEVSRGGRVVGRDRLLIRRAGERGRFVVRFSARRSGRHIVRASHPASDRQRAFSDVTAVRAVSLRPRARGLGVRLLQAGLARLAYRSSRSGSYDAATGRAVLAFRKVNGMARTMRADRRILAMLLRGEGGYRLRHPGHGKHVEADLSRQVLVLADGGRPLRIYHTSTGASATPTIRGSYRFYRKDLGTNGVGMVHSSYFRGGYAIHGYRSVPTHPASHGCLRVPIPNALEIFRWIELGDRIDVYA